MKGITCRNLKDRKNHYCIDDEKFGIKVSFADYAIEKRVNFMIDSYIGFFEIPSDHRRSCHIAFDDSHVSHGVNLNDLDIVKLLDVLLKFWL